MKDNYWMFPFAIVGFFMIIGLIIMGGKMENERIYDKCLTTNSSMVYNELTKMCKEVVK